jgi:hypothetical protein
VSARRVLVAALLVATGTGLSGCAGSQATGPAGAARTAAAPPAAGGPAWAAEGDRSDRDGSTFVCEGEGPTEEAALAAAHALCNDKVCKLCGVEVESVVQTTETLKGVSMQRKVVERCRRFHKGAPKVAKKSTDCGDKGCATWLAITFSKDDEKSECSAYAAEHFADPDECQRLIEAYRTTPGRDAASFRKRTALLDEALVACKDIDVRPTPLIDALHEKLIAGMDGFEFTPGRQQDRLEEPFFDTTWYKSRQQMMEDRSATDAYLTSSAPLRQQIRETATLVGRIQIVRDYVANRALVFDVIEATRAPDLDGAAGLARLLAALRAAPPGKQYGSGDIHFFPMYLLADLRGDISSINAFYRASYRPEALSWQQGIPFASLFAQDHKVDETEWNYLFALHKKNDCPVCLIKLLEVEDHGGAKVRDARFLALLDHALEGRRAGDRKRVITEIFPHDPKFTLHIRPLLPPDLQGALDWEFFRRRIDEAEEADDQATVRAFLPLAAASLAGGERPDVTCSGLADRLTELDKRSLRAGAPTPPMGDTICACLTGPMAKEPTRNLVNKSELYDRALALKLPCVQPR